MFLTVKDTPANYHAIATNTDLIKSITGCSAKTANAIAKLLTIRAFREIPQINITEAGLSANQYKKLKAASEFGKRDYLGIATIDSQAIEDPGVASKHFQDLIGSSHVEMGAILVLDIQYRIIHKEVFSIGTEDACLFYPRQAIEIVLRHRGTGFIVSHNHPSGKTEPSPEDIKLTDQLLRAAQLIELEMLDHLVVSAERYTSIRQTSSIWESNKITSG